MARSTWPTMIKSHFALSWINFLHDDPMVANRRWLIGPSVLHVVRAGSHTLLSLLVWRACSMLCHSIVHLTLGWHYLS